MYFRFSAIVWYVFFVESRPIRTKSMELLLDQSLRTKNVKATEDQFKTSIENNHSLKKKNC